MGKTVMIALYHNLSLSWNNSKNNNVRMKLQLLQMIQNFIECKIVVGGASVHISNHSLFRLKITVGCRLCAYPSIR